MDGQRWSPLCPCVSMSQFSSTDIKFPAEERKKKLLSPFVLWATVSADASIRMMFALQLRREPLREVRGHGDGWLQRCSEPRASVASIARGVAA